MARLLILSCSDRKFPGNQPLPAMERYDGPAFKTLRRFAREHPERMPDVAIISAKYGLIAGDHPIDDYNRELSAGRARELHSEVLARLRQLAANHDEMLICVTDYYATTIEGYCDVLPPGVHVQRATGRRGEKLHQLRNWLLGIPLTEPVAHRSVTVQGWARLRGKTIRRTPNQVLDLARQRLAEGIGNPKNYRTWYVSVDDRRLATKWLVAQLFDLSTREFQTGDARRVLKQLGIEAKRISATPSELVPTDCSPRRSLSTRLKRDPRADRLLFW